MKPDPNKVQALQDLPTPQNQKELQSFLGLINYLQPFPPDLAHKTTFLHKQVSTWDWTPSTDASFHRLKQWICNTRLKRHCHTTTKHSQYIWTQMLVHMD